MVKPLLSVCIITYNHAQYIRKCLDTVLEQRVNFQWQIIIADDCSTDGTQEILLEYKEKYPERIRLVLQKSNLGPEKNWLDLLSHAKSEYVLYGEGDDYFIDPTKLQRQVDFLESHEDFSVCFHPVKVVYDDGSRPDELFPLPEQRANKKVLEFKDLLVRNFMQTNSVMYRWRFAKEDVHKVFPKGIVPGDWFLHLLHAQVGKIGFIDRAMSVYRRHPGGVWWEADNNIDNIWRKYGIPHLRLYVEMFKLQSTQQVPDLVSENIRTVFHGLNLIDRRKNEGLVRAAVEQVPQAAELFIDAESKDVERLLEVERKQITEIEALRYALSVKEEQSRVLTEELHLIKVSRIWRTRNKLAKVVGKKPS